MRYAISSEEEVWVRVCAKFFERHGEYDWYLVPKDQALREMLRDSNGQASPHRFLVRIGELYKSVGVKE